MKTKNPGKPQCFLLVALRTLARATITFDRQLHYLIILSPIQSNSKLYPHCRKNARDFNAVLTFAVRGPWTRGQVVVIEPVLCFLNCFHIFLWSGTSSRQLTLPVSFDTKKHSNLSEFCVSVCRICRRLTSRSRNIVLNCSSAEIAV